MRDLQVAGALERLEAGERLLPGLSAPWTDLECTDLRGALCEGPPG